MSVPVGCRRFGKRLLPHFEVMSPVGKTPWRASIKEIDPKNGVRFQIQGNLKRGWHKVPNTGGVSAGFRRPSKGGSGVACHVFSSLLVACFVRKKFRCRIFARTANVVVGT